MKLEWKTAWMLWSTKALTTLAEAGQLGGAVLSHQARRLEHAAGRRFSRFVEAESERTEATAADFSDPWHGAREP